MNQPNTTIPLIISPRPQPPRTDTESITAKKKKENPLKYARKKKPQAKNKDKKFHAYLNVAKNGGS